MLHSKHHRLKIIQLPSTTTNSISLEGMMERKIIATSEFSILIGTAGLSQPNQVGFLLKDEMATLQLLFEIACISLVDG